MRSKNEKVCETHSKQNCEKNHFSEETVSNGKLLREYKFTTNNNSMKKNARGKREHLIQQSKYEAESDNTFLKFVDTFNAGSEEEDACHHGLVEPTINKKEALSAINNMFKEPLDPLLTNKRSKRSQTKPKLDQNIERRFEIFIDENMNDTGLSNQNGENIYDRSLRESFQIYADEEGDDVEETDIKNDFGNNYGFVFSNPNDILECFGARQREDTFVRRFVGATILNEPKVENVCHHGLVEPTINLKEAMDDINSMFGKSIDFVRTTRQKRKEKALSSKNKSNEFVIFSDIEVDHHRINSRPCSTAKTESELFEPLVCTKEAVDEINKMFAMPLDF